MISIQAACLADASVIHAIQMRAFAEEGRLGNNMQIPPLTETLAAIQHHIQTQTVLVARELVAHEGERIVGSARGIV